MTRKLWFLVVLFVALTTLGARTTSAQVVDARKVLEAAAKAMGTTNLKSIQFTADGFLAKVGEQYNLTDGWPQFAGCKLHAHDRLRRQVYAPGL